MPDGMDVDGAPNELFSKMDELFARKGGRAVWVGLFQSSLDRWAALAGVSYTRITYGGNDWDDGASFGSWGSSTRGDIRIAMTLQDGAGGMMAYNYFPDTTTGKGGDMVLDRDETWSSGASNYRLLRNVIMHEHGHGLGLQHVCPVDGTKLMEPSLSISFDGPQHDDIRAAHRNYGDHYEANDTVATATSLGILTPGVTLTLGPVPTPAVNYGSVLSIEGTSSQDLLQFDAAAPGAINVTVTPLGLSYDSSTQNSDGTCNSGNYVNSRVLADLDFDVLGPDGSTVLWAAQASPAGVAESLSRFMLPLPGSYFIRVFAANVPSQPQLYTISVSLPDCNHNGVSDAIDLLTGTSQDCNSNSIPDECDSTSTTDKNHNLIPDVCEYRHGDFDLDGDVDMVDFARLQRCLLGPGIPQTDPACANANLNGNLTVDDMDVTIFLRCLSGPDKPYDRGCS